MQQVPADSLCSPVLLHDANGLGTMNCFASCRRVVDFLNISMQNHQTFMYSQRFEFLLSNFFHQLGGIFHNDVKSLGDGLKGNS